MVEGETLNSKLWVVTLGVRQSKLLIGRSSDKLSRDLLAMDKKLHAGNGVVNWPVYIEAAYTHHWATWKVSSAGNVWTGGEIFLPYTLLLPSTGWS